MKWRYLRRLKLSFFLVVKHFKAAPNMRECETENFKKKKYNETNIKIERKARWGERVVIKNIWDTYSEGKSSKCI